MKSRKTNRAKKVDPSCKNHGSCPWCEGNRTHSNKKREPARWEEERDLSMRTLREASILIYGD